MRVTVAPGRRPPATSAGVAVSPPSGGLMVGRLADDIRGRPAGGDLGASAAGQHAPRLRGSVPLGAPPVSRDVSVDNPTLFFVSALRTALIAHGIDVRGPAVDIDDIRDAPPPPTARRSISHRSPPLSTLAVRLMKTSQNLYAETFLKTLGPGASGTVRRPAGRSRRWRHCRPGASAPDGLDPARRIRIVALRLRHTRGAGHDPHARRSATLAEGAVRGDAADRGPRRHACRTA